VKRDEIMVKCDEITVKRDGITVKYGQVSEACDALAVTSGCL
jgi:ABC-type sugar transport system ATPase subunit